MHVYFLFPLWLQVLILSLYDVEVFSKEELRDAFMPQQTIFAMHDSHVAEYWPWVAIQNVGSELLLADDNYLDRLHARHILVRTRADSELIVSPGRLEAVLRAGAHFIQTDFAYSSRGSQTAVRVPGPGHYRCNPRTSSSRTQGCMQRLFEPAKLVIASDRTNDGFWCCQQPYFGWVVLVTMHTLLVLHVLLLFCLDLPHLGYVRCLCCYGRRWQPRRRLAIPPSRAAALLAGLLGLTFVAYLQPVTTRGVTNVGLAHEDEPAPSFYTAATLAVRASLVLALVWLLTEDLPLRVWRAQALAAAFVGLLCNTVGLVVNAAGGDRALYPVGDLRSPAFATLSAIQVAVVLVVGGQMAYALAKNGPRQWGLWLLLLLLVVTVLQVYILSLLALGTLQPRSSVLSNLDRVMFWDAVLLGLESLLLLHWLATRHISAVHGGSSGSSSSSTVIDVHELDRAPSDTLVLVTIHSQATTTPPLAQH